MRKYNAFTLIEVMLSVSLLALISGGAFYLSNNIISKSNTGSAKDIVETALYKAQQEAISGKYDSNIGVKIGQNSVVIFSGDSYATRDVDKDSPFDYPSPISVSGTDEFVFTKVTGKSSASNTVSITSNNSVEVVRVNLYGVY